MPKKKKKTPIGKNVTEVFLESYGNIFPSDKFLMINEKSFLINTQIKTVIPWEYTKDIQYWIKLFDWKSK